MGCCTAWQKVCRIASSPVLHCDECAAGKAQTSTSMSPKPPPPPPPSGPAPQEGQRVLLCAGQRTNSAVGINSAGNTTDVPATPASHLEDTLQAVDLLHALCGGPGCHTGSSRYQAAASKTAAQQAQQAGRQALLSPSPGREAARCSHGKAVQTAEKQLPANSLCSNAQSLLSTCA